VGKKGMIGRTKEEPALIKLCAGPVKTAKTSFVSSREATALHCATFKIKEEILVQGALTRHLCW